MALALFSSSSVRWFAIRGEQPNWGRPHGTASRHPLILDGLLDPRALRRSGKEKCLHVLSSFQRTGLARARLPSTFSSLGEPSNPTSDSPGRQPLFRQLPLFCGPSRRDGAANRGNRHQPTNNRPEQWRSEALPLKRLGSCELSRSRGGDSGRASSRRSGHAR